MYENLFQRGGRAVRLRLYMKTEGGGGGGGGGGAAVGKLNEPIDPSLQEELRTRHH